MIKVTSKAPRRPSKYRDDVIQDVVEEENSFGRERGFNVIPKTKNQERLLNAIENAAIVVALGSAGVGKTYCGVGKGAMLFNKGKYKSIVMTRSIIPTGKSMGFLPGDVTEKMVPWLLPMISVLEKAFGKTKYEYMFAKGIISIQPLETIRGRSFEDSLIFVDEAQNLSDEEIKAITTRLGENSKMVLMGDAFQSDLQGKCALLKFAEMCERHSIKVPVVEFTVDDIVRSDIVAQLVKMFMYEAQKK
jgi:phosphate starvation-inducible PhoH-like protein